MEMRPQLVDEMTVVVQLLLGLNIGSTSMLLYSTLSFSLIIIFLQHTYSLSVIHNLNLQHRNKMAQELLECVVFFSFSLFPVHEMRIFSSNCGFDKTSAHTHEQTYFWKSHIDALKLTLGVSPLLGPVTQLHRPGFCFASTVLHLLWRQVVHFGTLHEVVQNQVLGTTTYQ